MKDLEQLLGRLSNVTSVLGEHVTSVWLYLQLGCLALAALLAWVAAAQVHRRLDLGALTMGWPAYARLLLRVLAANTGIIAFVVLSEIARAAMVAYAPPGHSYLIAIAIKLGTAWLIISLIAGLIHNRIIVRIAAVTAWTVAALSILGVLDGTLHTLDSVAFVIGGVRISPLVVIKLTLFMLLTLWLATSLSNFLEQRIYRTREFTPTVQVMLAKLTRLSLVITAILIVLSSAGINLSALALFSGAAGVGIGFGSQKIVSNFVSGIILLAEKSIKPGDVVTVGDGFGWVGKMSTRHVSVVTGDGREFLIPNEDLVTQRVINWSYSNREVCLNVTFGVSYDSDPHLVRRVAAEAAASAPRVLRTPEPSCYIHAFGQSSIDFLLGFWIDDPAAGVANVRGDVMLAVWDAFKREGIRFPYPVRELALTEPVRVIVGEAPPERVPATPIVIGGVPIDGALVGRVAD
ncbi:MAG: mechanosensitive ion channel family protein [Xanthobacteraceae bacterium]